MSITELLDALMPLIYLAAMLGLFVLINWLVDRL